MIEGEKVKLRGFEKKDTETVHEAMNNPSMVRYLSSFSPFSKEEEEEWIEETWEARKKGEKYAFAVELKDSGELIGSVSLMSVNQRNRRAEIGAWIKEGYWGKGYGSEASELICKYGFKELNLHSIQGKALENNKRSQETLKKIGFKETGKLREAAYRHGEYRDMVCFDLLKREMG